MKATMWLRVTAETARSKGIEWNARGIFFSDRRSTIELLEKVLDDLRGEEKRDDD